MKIKVNYDLIQEINLYKKGFYLNRNINKGFKFAMFFFVINVIDDLVSGTHDPKLLENLFGIVTGTMTYSVISSLMDNIPFIKDINKETAYQHLKSLSTSLGLIDVKTNPSLLEDAKFVEQGFKLVKNDKDILVLEHYKYIEVPTRSDFGYEGSETILQEHIIGTNKYDLSVGSPNTKVKKFIKAFGGI